MRVMKRTRVTTAFVIVLVLILSLLPLTVGATPPVFETSLITKGSSGLGGNSDSLHSLVSADGTKVAFQSRATDLISGITTNTQDNIFLYDVTTGVTTLVTTGSSGVGGNGPSQHASISADGTKIAFTSSATDLITGTPTNTQQNVFLYDVTTGVTTLVTTGSSGVGGNGPSIVPYIAADGTKIVLTSSATDLITGTPTNTQSNVFLYDVTTGVTTLVTTGSSGSGGDAFSGSASISADGTKIAFSSWATDLITGTSTNTRSNVFLYDVTTGVTTLVTTGTSGNGGDASSGSMSISSDGSAIVLTSSATDLIAGTVTSGQQIFVYDIGTNLMTLVSAGSSGVGGNFPSFGSIPFITSISANGDTVVFYSNATDLVPGITTNGTNVFLYDVTAEMMTLVSAGSSGVGGGGTHWSGYPSISADGNSVTFWSVSNDLISGVTTASPPPQIFLWTRTFFVDVTFDAQNGDATWEETIVQGTEVPEPTPQPIRPGFVFNGWWTASSGGTEWDFSDPVTADMTLFAQWKALITITYDAKNGTTPLVVPNIVEGSLLTAPTPPTRAGYTFAGWWSAPTSGTQWTFATDTAPATDMTLYAQWVKNAPDCFSVTYRPGTTDSVQNLPIGGTYLAGDKVTVAKAATRFGYRLLGYQIATVSSANASLFATKLYQPGQTFTMPATNVQATAMWQKVWKIVVDPGNGNPPTIIEVDDGGFLTPPPAPTRPGYEFVGWFNADGTPFDFSKPITGPVELFAGWRTLGTPKTGDTAMAAAPLLILLASVGLILGTTIALRRKEHLS